MSHIVLEEPNGCVLELLIFIDDLYAMLILLFGGVLAHIRKVTVDGHD